MTGEAHFRFSIRVDPRSAKDGGGYIAFVPGWPAGGPEPPTAIGATAAEAVAALEPLMSDWILATWSVERPPPDLHIVPKDQPNDDSA